MSKPTKPPSDPLGHATGVHRQTFSVDRAMRQHLNQHGAAVLWFTGLSGAGKSTIANLVDARLYRLRCRTTLLDGDNVRQGLNRDLGFTDADRTENIRRIAEVAKLFVDTGIITLVAFISPFRADRQLARALLTPGDFIEIFIDTPLAVCRQRDPKGLYRRAEQGLIKNFTGIDSPYEPPESPELHLRPSDGTADEQADSVVATLRRMGVVG